MSERIRVELRFKNAVLFNALRERFPPTDPCQRCADLKAASKHSGVSYEQIAGLISLYVSPWLASGQPRPAALKLSLLLGIDCDALFPVRLYSNTLPRTLSREIDGTRYLSICEAAKQKLLPRSTVELDLPDEITRGELQHTMDSVLSTLTSREETVIRKRFGLTDDSTERTLAEVAAELGCTGVRVREIEQRALSKLRHPGRSRQLRDFLPMRRTDD